MLRGCWGSLVSSGRQPTWPSGGCWRRRWQWAVIHPAETLDDAEGYASRVHLAGVDEQPLTLAGPGAPLVREFAVAEFAAAIGVSTEAGKRYVGHALELRYRLPRLWAAVICGELAAWKGRRVAHETIGHSLSAQAAAFVDAHVAPVAHKIRPAQLDRLVEEAVGRFMPEAAERRRREAADGRFFRVDHDQVSFAGTSLVTGELDLADALDLDDAIRGIAAQLGDLGSTEPLDVRRSVAAGELARRQLALDLTTEDTGENTGGDRPRRHRTTSRTVLHLHLSHAALTGADPVGRVENTRTPVTAEQIRAWCGRPETALVVKPVIDLADHVHVEAYEVPDRIAERVALRDHTCAFPWCTRPARSPGPGRARRATATTSIPYRDDDTDGRGTHRRAPAGSHPCAGDITASRPTRPGPTRSSNPAPTCGPAPTATTTSATTTAPSTSPPTDTPPAVPGGHHTPEIDPAPHPAHRRGHRHACTGQPAAILEAWAEVRMETGRRPRA